MNKEKFLKLARQAILKYDERYTLDSLDEPIWYEHDCYIDTYKVIFKPSFLNYGNLFLVSYDNDEELISVMKFKVYNTKYMNLKNFEFSVDNDI